MLDAQRIWNEGTDMIWYDMTGEKSQHEEKTNNNNKKKKDTKLESNESE